MRQLKLGRVVVVALIALAVGVGLAAASGTGSSPRRAPARAGLEPFSTRGVFLAGARGPAATDSDALVDDFTAQVARYLGHVVINTTESSAPVFVVGASTPTRHLRGESSICPRPSGVWHEWERQIEHVPLPANMYSAAGSDKEAVIYQPSTGHLWELWRAVKEGSRWTACWGDEIADVSKSGGRLPAPFGVSAAGLSILAGQIHIEDLEHGAIDHALEVMLPETEAGHFVWPANRDDGNTAGGNAIPEGTRFRFPPSLDVKALHLPRPAEEVVRAIQRYGLIVGDTSGAVALLAQDPTPIVAAGRPDPYDRLLRDPDDVLDSVPWGDLEALAPPTG